MKSEFAKRNWLCFSLVLLLLIGLFIPFASISVKAEDAVEIENLPEIYDVTREDNSGIEELDYGTGLIELGIRNFDDFALDGTTENDKKIEYSVVYYFIRQSNDETKQHENFVYEKIATVEISYEDNETHNENGHLPFSKFENSCSGTYIFKATILKNGKLVATPEDFVVKITNPSGSKNNLMLAVSQEKLSNGTGEFGTYLLTASLKTRSAPVDISKYNVKWYAESGKKVLISTSPSFEWTPSSEGSFKVSVQIDELNGISNHTTIIVARDYSDIAVIILIAIALIMTLFVVLFTVRRVKKERIW